MIDFAGTIQLAITLLGLTFLWKQQNNVYYEIMMALYGGTAIGYMTNNALVNLWSKSLVPISNGTDYTQIIPLVIAVLLFFGYTKNYKFVSRYPSVVLVASNMGAACAGAIITMIYLQAVAPVTDISTAVTVIWTIILLLYFLMTFRYEGKAKYLGYTSTIGRTLLMIGFGAMFGTWALTSFNSVTLRLQYIFWQYLGIKV